MKIPDEAEFIGDVPVVVYDRLDVGHEVDRANTFKLRSNGQRVIVLDADLDGEIFEIVIRRK